MKSPSPVINQITEWLLVCRVAVVFVWVGFFLVGCTSPHYVELNESKKLPSKVNGADDALIIWLQEDLRKRDVKIISMGENNLISIPASMLFPDEAPHLTWPSYELLNEVVCYLQQYRKIAVTVSVYTVPYRTTKRQDALSIARARAVGDYLWSQGIDSRFIFTQGRGSVKPIINYDKNGDQSVNSRVEITFREAII